MNSLKRWSLTAVTGLFLVLFTAKSWGANPDSMNITVSVGVVLSVDITGDPYDFGSISAGITTVSTRAITVTNDTGGRTQDYTIRGSNTASWSIASTAGSDQFGLFAMLNSVQPASGDFSTTNDDLTTFGQNMDSTNFAGDENGDDVVDTATRSLWFRMDTPTSSASQAEQTVTVTVTAADASTF